jgi:hypothetical protein
MNVKGTVPQDFRPSDFFIKQSPWAPDSRAKTPRYDRFSNAKIVNFYIFKVCWIGQFGNIYILIDIPFKGRQGRSNRSSIVHTVPYCSWNRLHLWFFLHNISVLHLIFTFRSCSKTLLCMRCKWHRMHPCTFAPCMRCQKHRMHFKKSNFFANSNLYSKRL